MNILAFDTCFNACSVAAARGLGGATPETSEHVEAMASGHAERLMPLIREAMAAVRLSFGELDRIAVTAGPGSFTGTRITVAAARAFALSTGAPIVAFSSLAVMAAHPMAAFTRRTGDLAIAVDARRGEVYFERFPRHGTERIVTEAIRFFSSPHLAEGEPSTRRGGEDQNLLRSCSPPPRGEGLGVGGTPTATVLQSPPPQPSPTRGEGELRLRPDIIATCAEAGTAAAGPLLLSIKAAAELLSAEGSTTVAGSGAEAVVAAARTLGRNADAILPDLVPRIGDILADAMTLLPLTTPLKPVYARPPDARPPSSPARP